MLTGKNVGSDTRNNLYDSHFYIFYISDWIGAGDSTYSFQVPGQLWANKLANIVTGAFVNIFRSIPFIILIILLIPFTKFLLGTMRGPDAAMPALIIGAAPFYGRMVLIALQEIDKGVIEAAKSMGAKTHTIIFKVLLPESMPALSFRNYRNIYCTRWVYGDGGNYWCRWSWNTGVFRWIPTKS